MDGEPVEATWTTSINLEVPLGELRPDATAAIGVAFRLDVARAPDAFTARLSRDNGVLSFGQWFPIAGPEHDVYGLGDPQITWTADAIRLDLTTTTPLPRDAVACPGLSAAPQASGTAWACEVNDVRDLSFVVNPRFALTTRRVDDHEVRVYTETVGGGRTADLAVQGLIGLEETFGGVSVARPRAGGGRLRWRLQHGVPADDPSHPGQGCRSVRGLPRGRPPVVLRPAREPPAARAVARRGVRRFQRPPPDGHRRERVLARAPWIRRSSHWEAGPTTGGDWTSCDGYFHAVFYQGTELITALRSAMGDDAFFSSMRAWVDEHRHGFVRGRDLVRHLAAAPTPISSRSCGRTWRAQPSAPLRLVGRPAPPHGPSVR